MRRFRLVAIFAAGVVASLPVTAYADCERAPGPLDVCRCDTYGTEMPALAETTTWVLAGGGWESGRSPRGERSSSSLAIVGIGAETTFGSVLTYRGFPAGPYYSDGRAELRMGFWSVAGTRLEGARALVESGLKAQLVPIGHGGANWGSFDVRLGAGYGWLDTGRAGYFVATLTAGPRSFLQRHGQCGVGPHGFSNEPKAHGYGSILRPFLTIRRALDPDAAVQITLGIELSPTFLMPPYGWSRAWGGPP